MALNPKLIKTRIKSIGSIKKITKAMEMISAVKMRRATENVLATRSYATLAWTMLKDVSGKTNSKLHPLLNQRQIKKIGILLITSNRGQCGGFVTKLLQETDRYIKKLKQDNQNLKVDIILMGKKGRKIFKYYGYEIGAEYEKFDLTTKIEEILPTARIVTAEYINEKYDKIVLAYTDFKSPVHQIPRVKELLPLGGKDEMLGQVMNEKTEQKIDTSKINNNEFKFEPDPKKVLNILLPKLVEMQIYQAILESDASEHSARMMAMRNATDAAGEMIDELNLTYNKARQAKITQEISEIVGGAAALE